MTGPIGPVFRSPKVPTPEHFPENRLCWTGKSCYPTGMEITNERKGRTYKSADVMGTDDKDAAFQVVLDHFGETTGRLFGWSVSAFPEDRDETGISVSLFTD